MYDHIRGIRDLLKQDLVLEFSRNQNKVISILIEPHINHDQIHNINYNWLGSNFFLLKIVTQKDACPASSGTWRLTLIQKAGLCPLSLLPLMTKFSVFISLQGIAPENRWMGDFFLKGCKIMWQVKKKEMKTKWYFKT